MITRAFPVILTASKNQCISEANGSKIDCALVRAENYSDGNNGICRASGTTWAVNGLRFGQSRELYRHVILAWQERGTFVSSKRTVLSP